MRAREVIADWVRGNKGIDALLADLKAAGFVIVPDKPCIYEARIKGDTELPWRGSISLNKETYSSNWCRTHNCWAEDCAALSAIEEE